MLWPIDPRDDGQFSSNFRLLSPKRSPADRLRGPIGRRVDVRYLPALPARPRAYLSGRLFRRQTQRLPPRCHPAKAFPSAASETLLEFTILRVHGCVNTRSIVNIPRGGSCFGPAARRFRSGHAPGRISVLTRRPILIGSSVPLPTQAGDEALRSVASQAWRSHLKSRDGSRSIRTSAVAGPASGG